VINVLLKRDQQGHVGGGEPVTKSLRHETMVDVVVHTSNASPCAALRPCPRMGVHIITGVKAGGPGMHERALVDKFDSISGI